MQQKAELRKRIRKTIQKFEEPTVEDIVSDVSRFAEVDEAEVLKTLDQFERHGFIYIVEQDQGREVRLT